MTKMILGPVAPADVVADPQGHVWNHDWMNVEGDGWRCVRCLAPGYRADLVHASCRRAGVTR